jgi:hypothetical protein
MNIIKPILSYFNHNWGENLKTLVSLFNMEYGDAHFLLTDWFIHKSKTMDTSHWEEIDRILHSRNVQKMISISTPWEKLQNLLNIIPS